MKYSFKLYPQPLSGRRTCEYCQAASITDGILGLASSNSEGSTDACGSPCLNPSQTLNSRVHGKKDMKDCKSIALDIICYFDFE